jgi:hypothetical protein
MSGDISPDDSADEGRGGSREGGRTKNAKVLSFLLFLSFLFPPAFIIERLIFQMYPDISPI